MAFCRSSVSIFVDHNVSVTSTQQILTAPLLIVTSSHLYTSLLIVTNPLSISCSMMEPIPYSTGLLDHGHQRHNTWSTAEGSNPPSVRATHSARKPVDFPGYMVSLAELSSQLPQQRHRPPLPVFTNSPPPPTTDLPWLSP